MCKRTGAVGDSVRDDNNLKYDSIWGIWNVTLDILFSFSFPKPPVFIRRKSIYKIKTSKCIIINGDVDKGM